MAVYPFARLTATNLGFTVHVDAGFTWILGVAVVSLGIVGLGEWLFRGSAARFATFLIPWMWLLFNFHHFEKIDSRAHLLWLGTTAAVGAAMVVASRAEVTRQLMGLWAILLVVSHLIPILGYSPVRAIDEIGSPPHLSAPIQRPNVWVFVPDGYTSGAEIEEQTGVVISGFLTALKEEGFETPDGLANYPTTFLSLASMLDQRLLVEEGDHVRERGPFYDRIRGSNRTVDQFRHWGYEYVFATTSSWEGSLCSGSEDLCLTGVVMNRTNQAILSVTPFEPLVDVRDDIEDVARYSDPRFVVEEVLSSEVTEPYLVISHLMEPHPPELRTSDCRIREDVSLDITRARWDPARYGASIVCLNRQFLAAIDQIIREDPDAVIVIHADHGTHLDRGTEPQIDHRYRVLSALRQPCDVPTILATVDVMDVVVSCLAGEDPTIDDYERFSLESFTVRRRASR